MKRISGAILIASSLFVTSSVANADQFLRMVSGPSGGSWYPLGAKVCLLYTSPSPRDKRQSRMPSSA